MKRIIASISALLLFCGAAFAQTEDEGIKFGVRVGYGLLPQVASGYFTELTTVFSSQNMTNMTYIYNDYQGPNIGTGIINAAFDVQILRWFTASLNVGYGKMSHKMYDGLTHVEKGEKVGHNFYILPEVKFTYFTREWIRLYGSLGLGVGKYIGYDQLKDSYIADGQTFSVDRSWKGESIFVPFGVECGKKLYVYAQCGFGTLYYGGQFGIGYKF